MLSRFFAISLVLLAFPPAASAGSGSVSSGVLKVSASSGQSNDIVANATGSTVEVTDVHPLAAGANCDQTTATQITCSGVTSILISANNGNDKVDVGGTLRATLNGGTGNDLLDGGLGMDTLDGGDGTDTLTYASRDAGQHVAIRLDGERNDGADPNQSGSSAAGEERDLDLNFEHAIGGAGRDRLIGDDGVNVLRGGPGDDKLDGGPAGDTLDGEDGTDSLYYVGRITQTPLVLRLDGVRNDGADPDRSGVSTPTEEADLDVSLENASGSNGPDRLVGDDGPNVLDGRDGDDNLDGRLGTDQLNCWSGRNDMISYATRGAPVAIRMDTISTAGADPDRDGVSTPAEEGDQHLYCDAATGGAAGDRFVSLNTYVGSTAPTYLFRGGSGNDVFHPNESGYTTMEGGRGNDTFLRPKEDETVNGGEGSDTVTYEGETGTAVGHVITLDGIRNDHAVYDGYPARPWQDISIENATGGPGPDQLTSALTSANVLRGLGGTDTLRAVDGSETADTLDCGADADSWQADPADLVSACEAGVR